MTKRLQRTILLSQFLMLLALEMTNPFLPLLITAIHHSTQAVVFYNTLALFLPMVANLLMAPLWGLAADRYGYKPMLMRSAWALVLTQASMIFAPSIEWILLIRTAQGAFAGFIAAMQAYALSAHEWDKKNRQLSRLQAAKGMATLLAGLAGGLVLACTSYHGLYATATIICLLTTVLMHQQLPATPQKAMIVHTKNENHAKPPLKGMLFFLCLLITLTQIARFLPDPVFSLFLHEQYPNNALLIGFLYSLPAAGLLGSAEWCGRQFDRCRKNHARINQYLLGYSFLGALVMIAHAFAGNIYLFAGARIIWGIVLAALLPALFSLLTDRIRATGYALGIANSLAKLGNLSGIACGGVIATWLSFRTFFLIVAAIYGFVAMLIFAYHLLTSRYTIIFFNNYSKIK
ncbi:MFS transporter [Legionella oakridgensis]|uniref:Arabinose efflux permease n=2 Tax=Legionella oakridgensis TaxID=29423 RepID=W0BBC0_9GAMM|nr:MFS transporter [Legionella oakridgensis]AHE65912.1 arabinose efflux permease [Legionella oakridgensis ATCC 33761 = DSM 21215]KTD43766.1 multidrug resistance efflux pump [Legionella oakridgensis]STY15843.1 multidrug resistance efflux pump [Legionella longbeachae]